MIDAFLADLQRYSGHSHTLTCALAVKLSMGYHGLQALLGYRLGRALLLARDWRFWLLLPFGWLLYFLISRYVRIAFDIRLDLSADIGPGLYIGHFGNIRVANCTLGTHCSIAQSVHIRPAATGAGPIVGDRVWIGAHAQIIGPHRIGTGSTISAGAVIQKDVPEHSLSLGNPARVILRNYDNRSILGITK